MIQNTLQPAEPAGAEEEEEEERLGRDGGGDMMVDSAETEAGNDGSHC